MLSFKLATNGFGLGVRAGFIAKKFSLAPMPNL
jgi:hypothetical protein